MREIKFRAWDKVRKEMRFEQVGEIGRIDLFFRRLHGVEIDIMQYTGLKDKNGKEIYEGDILDGGYLNPLTGQKVKHYYLVEFERGIFYAKLIGKSPYGDTFLYFQNKRSAIIGNVHENKELLEVEKC